MPFFSFRMYFPPELQESNGPSGAGKQSVHDDYVSWIGKDVWVVAMRPNLP
jgi:hypothetical protein